MVKSRFKKQGSKKISNTTAAAVKNFNLHTLEEGDDAEISKSELKRQMTYLQTMGESLLTLNNTALTNLKLSPSLIEALATAARIKHREGKRRQMQFVGKLMRKEPSDTIERIRQLLDTTQQAQARQAAQFHHLEAWRDRLLSTGAQAIEQFIEAYPQADRQWLRQIVRQHQQELSKQKPLTASRKLFSYLKETIHR